MLRSRRLAPLAVARFARYKWSGQTPSLHPLSQSTKEPTKNDHMADAERLLPYMLALEEKMRLHRLYDENSSDAEEFSGGPWLYMCTQQAMRFLMALRRSPQGLPRVPRGSPEGPRGSPEGLPRVPRGSPKEPPRAPSHPQGSPEGAKPIGRHDARI